MTRVLNVRDLPRPLPDGVVYVGRPMRGLPRGPWGNPFKIGEGATRYHAGYDRDTVIRLHRKWLIERLEREPNYLEPLRSKQLACWCSPLPCHADNLVEFLDKT